MSLSMDFSSSLWFMPEAVWEWEAAPAPEAADATPAACSEAPPQRLVFKGYANADQFHCFALDSALARPWTRSQVDDAEHRHRTKPPLPSDDAPAEPQ
jgi:hypothetical protein